MTREPDRAEPPPGPPPGRMADAGPRLPVVDSERLLQGARCVEIRHNGEIYRLQATRLGKLILTK